jgi:hypothetical protein
MEIDADRAVARKSLIIRIFIAFGDAGWIGGVAAVTRGPLIAAIPIVKDLDESR